MILDELNKKIADIESLATDKTSTIESKVSELQDGLLMVADAVDTIPGVIDEKITAITKEFATIKDTVKKVKAQKGDKGDRGEPGIDGIGIKGDKGEDGSPDTGEQIADKLNELEGVLDTKVLKDFTMPDVSNLQTQINTIGNQTLRLLSRPTSSSFTGVTTDSTLSGLGTTASPLSVISVAPSDVAITVRAATTANLAGSPVYANGTSGVGATLTRGTNGTLPTQDGVTLAVNDRILVKNQTTTLQNGIYVVTSLGSASTKWVLTRATDSDSTTELDELVVTVSEGSTNRGTVWGQQTNNPTVGTSAITFATATSTAVTQATSGTQAIYQIPTLTGTARQITRGTANFKYNPTNDLFTIRGVDYTFPANNGDASQVLTTDGSGTLSWTTPSGGSLTSTYIGYGDGSNALTGSSNFIWNESSKELSVGDLSNVSAQGKILMTQGTALFQAAQDYYLSLDSFGATGTLFLSADDSIFNIKMTGTGGGKNMLLLDTLNAEYSIGDLDTLGNGTKIVIDDAAQLITISNVPSYADDSAATTAGLTTGQLYKTTTGGSTFLKIVP